MIRSLTPWAAVTLILVLGAAGAWAAEPREAWNCSVNPADYMNGVILAPDLPQPLFESVLHITIRNDANNPIPGATVEVRLHESLNVCPDAVLTGVTDGDGYVQITAAGGGCVALADRACVVVANGVTIRNYHNAKSPDWDGHYTDGVVDVRDLVGFFPAFNHAAQGGCFDYDNSGTVAAGDFGIFARAFNARNHCP